MEGVNVVVAVKLAVELAVGVTVGVSGSDVKVAVRVVDGRITGVGAGVAGCLKMEINTSPSRITIPAIIGIVY